MTSVLHACTRAARAARALLVLLLAAGLAGVGGSARADWPMARHDSQRVGAAAGKSNIQKPEVAWSAFLGGSLGATNLLTADVEGNGKNAFILAAGGLVTAVQPDGTTLWKATLGGLATLLGVADLNGDGKQELVVYTGVGALALDLRTGTVAWAQPTGEMGSVAAVRLADMTGDGLPDLVIGECRSCVGGNAMQTGFIYAFSAGFAKPTRVSLPYPDTGVGFELTPVNMDGTGGDQLLIGATGSFLKLVDGTNGMVLATSADLAYGTSQMTGCLPAAVAGSPAQRVVCLLSEGGSPTPGATDSSRVIALEWKPGSPTLDVVWSYSAAPAEALVSGENDLVVDLAGDGNLETLVTAHDAAGTSTVHVIDTATGTEITSIPGVGLFGTAAALPNDQRVIVTGSSTTSQVWSLTSGSATSLGMLTGEIPPTSIDWARFAISSSGTQRPIAIDANGDGLPDLVTFTIATAGLSAYTPTPGTLKLVDTLTPSAASAEVVGVWPLPAMDRAYPQLGVAEPDGTLHLLDQAFALTSSTVRFGGYYAAGAYNMLGSSPVAASLGGAKGQQILAIDSTRTLVRFDASQATPTTPPTEVWKQLKTSSPAIVPGLDGADAGVFALFEDGSTQPPTYAARRLRADGSLVWQVSLASQPLADIATGDFDGDGVPDLAVQVRAANTQDSEVVTFSGADGHPLWDATVPGCYLQNAVSITDWDGDGKDDVIQQAGGTHVASGANGQEIAMGGPADCYYLAILFDTNGDGADEVTYTAGFISKEYAHDLTTKIFTGSPTAQSFPYGSIASCPDGPVLVQGSSSIPAQLVFTQLSGATPGQAVTIYLEGGSLYTTQSSSSAVGGSQLTAANVHQDLTGTGHPSAVVGSGDGWLYAVNPCAGTLDFAYSFGVPVGEPVFGDTDGDGLDEIIVSVADGNLYALRQTPSMPGTGGSGTGGSGTGGSGTGGSGTGGSGRGPWIPLWGRGGCYCAQGPVSPGSPAGLAFAAGLVLALARRRRR